MNVAAIERCREPWSMSVVDGERRAVASRAIQDGEVISKSFTIEMPAGTCRKGLAGRLIEHPEIRQSRLLALGLPALLVSDRRSGMVDICLQKDIELSWIAFVVALRDIRAGEVLMSKQRLK